MSFKKAAVLAVAFMLLGVLYFLVEQPFGTRQKKEPVSFIADFEKGKADAAAVFIKTPAKGSVQLKKNETGSWTVALQETTYAADMAVISSLLDAVAKLKEDTVASRNPQNFDGFEVTEEKAVEVRIDDGAQKALAHFYVGKNGPDIFSTYIRKKDSNTVLLVNSLLKNVFDREPKDWRDKTIVKLTKDDITEYLIEGDMTLAMKKDEKGLWQVAKPEAFPAKKDEAEKTVANFADVKAVDFPEGKLSEFGLDSPKRKITAVLKDGSKETLLVGKDKNAYQYFVKPQNRDSVYLVEKYELESLCPALDTLKEPETKEEKKSDNATS